MAARHQAGDAARRISRILARSARADGAQAAGPAPLRPVASGRRGLPLCQPALRRRSAVMVRQPRGVRRGFCVAGRQRPARGWRQVYRRTQNDVFHGAGAYPDRVALIRRTRKLDFSEEPKMSGLLHGKVALITGAANGIGRATALAAAREGAKVLVVDAVAAGEETAKAIKQAGGEAAFHKCDVTRAAEVEATVAAAVKQFGRLDCAHNNAGIIGKTLRTADDTEENFDRIIEVDLKGVWLCMKYEILQMLKQGARGAIVNTASAAGL